jgi:hypothetical protein
MGANAGRLPQTDRDAFRALSQVRGSPADSVRPVQTGRSWLGVKGSRVQIPPSRLFFERLYSAYSTKVQQPGKQTAAPSALSPTGWGLGSRFPSWSPGCLRATRVTSSSPSMKTPIWPEI